MVDETRGAADGQDQVAMADLVRAVETAPADHQAMTALADACFKLGRNAEAESLYRMVATNTPERPISHTNLGVFLEAVGRFDEALDAYRQAVALLPRCPAHRRLLRLLLRLGRVDDAIAVWEAESARVPLDPLPLRECWRIALEADRLAEGAAFAERNARVRWATRFWPERRADDPAATWLWNRSDLVIADAIKAPKLRHDIEQFAYLKERGVFGDEIDPIVRAMQGALARIADLDENLHHPLTDEERRSFGPVYGRITHVASAPRVPRALSSAFDAVAIEDRYLAKSPGIVTIDRLLSDEALASLRRFCLESTLWSGSTFADGYLQANFFNGFSAPLLLQIAEELRAAMPRVIGDLALTKMWAFKYDHRLNGIRLHGDEAVVNVNFWITPDDANLDQESGGLVVYDVKAPAAWSFDEYNGHSSPERLDRFLADSGAKAITVPHRQNRAVIFDSDLFHATAPLHFKPGYENRRINVTMLYGLRRGNAAK
jgi:hypothetical protein